jgi:molybdopterin molybdotransferase
VGDYDFGAETLSKLGFQLHFQGVDLRPGKPLIFGMRGRQAAFVIPGNPVSHFVVFHTVIRLALERLEGIKTSFALAELPLACAMPANSSPRETFWPARVGVENGRLEVRPLGWHSSGDLCALVSVNALVQRRAGAPELAAAQVVHCVLLDAR